MKQEEIKRKYLLENTTKNKLPYSIDGNLWYSCQGELLYICLNLKYEGNLYWLFSLLSNSQRYHTMYFRHILWTIILMALATKFTINRKTLTKGIETQIMAVTSLQSGNFKSQGQIQTSPHRFPNKKYLFYFSVKLEPGYKIC